MKKSKKATTSNFSHILLGISAILFGISTLACGVGFFKYQMGKIKTPMFSANYSVQNQKIYYYDKWVYAADPQSFQLLGYGYARDRNDIFYDGRVVDGVDYRTFAVISYGMATDKNQVWIFDKPTGVKTDKPITPLGNLYFRKGNQVFYQGREVTEADADTFNSMSVDHMGRDQQNIYFKGRKVALER